MQSVRFNNRNFYIKRDDLLSQEFSGNKARKFAYFLNNDFPEIEKIVGYGSVQANSLYSLAALAKLKGWQLTFYCHHIPAWLKQQPTGNYKAALALGADILEVDATQLDSNLDDYMTKLALSFDSSVQFVPEGGRCLYAEYGVKQLADEIIEFVKSEKLNAPIIMLPAGTGTTALYLQKNLPYQVLSCACVGDDKYLAQQFAMLTENQKFWPQILSQTKKYHFGKLYPEFFSLWQNLLAQTQVEFDLLYDPLGWLNLLSYIEKNQIDSEIIYIHQGGLLGNESMKPRYERKYGL